jgi:hypothetical protein
MFGCLQEWRGHCLEMSANDWRHFRCSSSPRDDNISLQYDGTVKNIKDLPRKLKTIGKKVKDRMIAREVSKEMSVNTLQEWRWCQ